MLIGGIGVLTGIIINAILNTIKRPTKLVGDYKLIFLGRCYDE